MARNLPKQSFVRLSPGVEYLCPSMERLPLNGSDHEGFAEIGVIFGDPCSTDSLFRDVVLPGGWAVIAKNGVEHYEIIDAGHNVRVKATYRSRDGVRVASVAPVRFYDCFVRAEKDGGRVAVVTKRGRLSYRAKPVYNDSSKRAGVLALGVGVEWLNKHYPFWRSYKAYWS